MTTWKDVAGVIAPYAPTIGKILGDVAPFPGGGMVGEFVGGLIAKQFCVQATPEAVDAAVRQEWASNPEAAAQKLTAADSEAAARWDALARMAEAEAADRTAQSQAINETMRAEIAAGVSFWHWRHLLGYVVLIQVFGLSFPVFKDLWYGNVANLGATQQLIAAITPIFLGLLALLGYVANDTTRLKETAITGLPRETIVSAAVRTMAGRK
jgi:hypothetical protein